MDSNIKTICFDEQDLEHFALASHDVNPLHMDPEFAAQTLYGKRVVFGVLTAFKCLEQLSIPRNHYIQHLQLEFRRTVFLEKQYQLVTSQQDDPTQAVVELREDDLVLLRLTAHFAQRQKLTDKEDTGNPFESLPVTSAAKKSAALYSSEDLLQPITLEGAYQICRTATIDNRKRLVIAKTIKSPYLDVLMLCSYLIGMEFAGTQCTFSKAKPGI